MNRKGTGTLRQHSSGWWEARIVRQGQTISKYGRSAEEAQAKLQEALTAVPEHALTVYELIDDWMKDGKGRWEPYTAHHHEYYVRDIKAVLPDMACLSVSRAVIRDFLRALDTPYKQWNLFRTLHSVFNYGVEWELIPYNPMQGMKRPKPQTKEKRSFTPQQARKFIENLGDRQYAPCYLFILVTGLRISEVAALTWDDIDFDQKRVSVSKKSVQFNGRRITGHPKSLASNRRLTLPDFVIDALHKQRSLQDKMRQQGSFIEELGLVFTTHSGRHIRRDDVAHRLKNYCREIGVPELTPHELRHSSGSLALQGGANLAEVSHHLGHASIAFTAQRYLHFVGDDTAVAGALKKLLAD